MWLKASRSLLSLVLLTSVAPGCSGVSLRPDGTPERQFCPDGAIEAMRELDIIPGSFTAIQIDRHQPDTGLVVIKDGAIQSVLTDSLGQIPEGTWLFGHVWTAAPEVIIRYHEALLPDSTRLPFCAVAEESGGGLLQHASSPKGSAILHDNHSGLRVVGAYL